MRKKKRIINSKKEGNQLDDYGIIVDSQGYIVNAKR